MGRAIEQYEQSQVNSIQFENFRVTLYLIVFSLTSDENLSEEINSVKSHDITQ